MTGLTFEHVDICSADEVASVQALIDALPRDQGCDPSLRDPLRGTVLTADPLLDVRWGVSSWGHTLRADCGDLDRTI